MRRYQLALALSLAAAGTTAFAHHDFSASYDDRSTVTIEAELVSLALRNPHSFMYVAVSERGGTAVRYEVEWSAAESLRRAGIDAATLKSGDRIILTGQPGRIRGNHRLRLATLHRPKDGLYWTDSMR